MGRYSKWRFSATDIVRTINDEDDYAKAGNYWRRLKKERTQEGVQLVSVTHELKCQAPMANCARQMRWVLIAYRA